MTLIQNITLIIAASLVSCSNPFAEEVKKNKPALNLTTARIKAEQALQYCRANKFNTDFCILIDISLHSGVNRFVVWNFETDSITHRFLVGHGCCKNPWNEDDSKDNPSFSNIDGSHCSSLGKYKIGERGNSDWGVNIKYLLHGLESTNNNACKRYIVFHSWEVVADEEVFPDGTPEGWGCPTISNNSFRILDPMLKESAKPVLMWIYK
ncbi:MAG: murein L,D-transpeptidase catalytic domain family protein [Bacteroidetes bacterium]|nr:murein L,D-transpeptidase catalytic domain family protein [Bacteroidota bacterium]